MGRFLRKARAIVWGEPPADPRESRLLLKIDWFVLSFICLVYWVNYLDRTNFANAYLAGMQQALDMKGNEFNIVNTVFTVGYTVGMLPNNLILLKVRPRYWLSFCALAWGLLVLGTYKCTNYRQICAIRFFMGIFESCTFSGAHLILGSWFKEEELAKRSAIFTSSGLIGSIFSGFMQSSIFTNLDGHGGLEGWQWLFIIDFIVTVPIALYGFLCFPDVPEKCSSLFFTEEEKKLAIERLPKRSHTKLDMSTFKRVLGRWHWYLFSFLWAMAGEDESWGSNSIFGLWLKFYGYTVPQRNNYPLGIFATAILATLSFAWYVDATGARYHYRVACVICSVVLVSTILILAKPLSAPAVFVAHYLSGFSYAGQATYFAWANVVCRFDLEERAITLASMNMFSNAVNAWWSILFYSASDAPKWRKGGWAMLATLIVTVLTALLIRYLQVREERSMDAAIEYVDGEYAEATAIATKEKPSEIKAVVSGSLAYGV